MKDTIILPDQDCLFFTAIIKQDGQWWIGWIEEIPGINCQEHSYEALKESLEETLAEAVRMNREEARTDAGINYREEQITVKI